MRKLIVALVVGALVAGGVAGPAAAGGYYHPYGAPYGGAYGPAYGHGQYGPPPYAHRYRDHERERRREVGAAIVLGIIGAATAAIIASQHQPRRHYRYR